MSTNVVFVYYSYTFTDTTITATSFLLKSFFFFRLLAAMEGVRKAAGGETGNLEQEHKDKVALFTEWQVCNRYYIKYYTTMIGVKTSTLL